MNKAKRFLTLFGLLCAASIMTGCSGINYTHGVSPATFLLPGLVNHEEQETDTKDVPEQAALVRVNHHF